MGIKITKVDTDGTKGTLEKSEFGYDDYATGGDAGRVYVGTGTENKALAFKEEVDAKLDNTANISVGMSGNILSITDIQGNVTDIDLSIYLDDTNLARIVDGSLDATTGVATFSRDDSTTFTLDLSSLLDTTVNVIDNLTSTDNTAALSANMGKNLQDQLDALTTTTEW